MNLHQAGLIRFFKYNFTLQTNSMGDTMTDQEYNPFMFLQLRFINTLYINFYASLETKKCVFKDKNKKLKVV